MSNVATLEQAPAGVIATMARQYNMDPRAFEATLRATVVPGNCTKEQFAAFLLVAREYGLNPITKEIYAFPAKGGIQPVVSIDGWMNLCNSHPQMDGLEFDDHIEGSKLTAVTARIWRKDRSHPTTVTEYLEECDRGTEPWKKWPRRMLRHKAAIQCARYAFGFAGIIDPDEAERMGTDVSRMRNVTPEAAPAETGQRMTPPPAPKQIAAVTVEHDPETGEIMSGSKLLPPDESAQLKTGLLRQLAKCGTTAALDQWNERAVHSLPTLQAGDREEVMRERDARSAEIYEHEKAGRATEDDGADEATYETLGEG